MPATRHSNPHHVGAIKWFRSREGKRWVDAAWRRTVPADIAGSAAFYSWIMADHNRTVAAYGASIDTTIRRYLHEVSQRAGTHVTEEPPMPSAAVSAIDVTCGLCPAYRHARGTLRESEQYLLDCGWFRRMGVWHCASHRQIGERDNPARRAR